jgi:hypothetical protein
MRFCSCGRFDVRSAAVGEGARARLGQRAGSPSSKDAVVRTSASALAAHASHVCERVVGGKLKRCWKGWGEGELLARAARAALRLRARGLRSSPRRNSCWAGEKQKSSLVPRARRLMISPACPALPSLTFPHPHPSLSPASTVARHGRGSLHRVRHALAAERPLAPPGAIRHDELRSCRRAPGHRLRPVAVADLAAPSLALPPEQS